MKTKVCFLNNYFEVCPGGAEYQTWLYASLLPKDKYETSFISVGSKGEQFYNEDKVYFRSQLNPWIVRFGDIHFLSWSAIRKILDKERPDVVISLGGYSYISPVANYKHRSYKFVWICASNMDLRRRPFNITRPFDFLGDTLRFNAIKKADCCYVQSKDQEEVFRQRFNREVGMLSNLQPIPIETNPKQYAQISVVWVANLKGLKQPELFIELAKRCQHHQNVNFIMIGSPNPSLSYQQRIETLMKGLPNFTYMGRQTQNQVNEVLSQAHILVNTSTHEGFSNVFVQAWLRSVPVMSLNEDPDELLSRQNLGFYAAGNLDTMTSQLETLLTDHELLIRMGAKAQAYATRTHSSEAILPALMEAIQCSSNTLATPV